MRIVTLTSETKQNLLENLLKRSTNDYGEYEKVVAEIIEQVKSRKKKLSLSTLVNLTSVNLQKRPLK